MTSTTHNAFANDASSPVAQRNAHKEKAERSRTRLKAMETLAAAPGEIYQVSQCAFAFFNANDALDATAQPTDRTGKGMNRARTSLANAFKSEASGIAAESRRSTASDVGIATELCNHFLAAFVVDSVFVVGRR